MTKKKKFKLLSLIINFIEFYKNNNNNPFTFNLFEFNTISEVLTYIIKSECKYKKLHKETYYDLQGIIICDDFTIRLYFGNLGVSPIIVDIILNSKNEPYEWKIYHHDFNFNSITNSPFNETVNQHDLVLCVPNDLNKLFKSLSKEINVSYEDLINVDNYLDLYYCYKLIPTYVIERYKQSKIMMLESLPGAAINFYRVKNFNILDPLELSTEIYEIMDILISEEIYKLLVLK